MNPQNLDRSHGKRKRKYEPKVPLTCDCGCGTQFLRYRNKIRYKWNYVSHSHGVAHQTRLNLIESCGPYLAVVTEYLDGYVQLRGQNGRVVRQRILPFFRFLCSEGVTSLQQVTPETVSRFRDWAQTNGYRAAARDTSPLSTFFKWALVEGHYEGDSPVITSVHGKRSKPRAARPYTPDQQAFIWKLLFSRGNARLRAVAAIAEEAGLRIGEICRLDVSDIDLHLRQIRVGLPNKTARERYAFFSDKTAECLAEWLSQRNPSSGHTFLFHNRYGGQLLHVAINREFRKALCRTLGGKKINDEGLASWSIHRMRHTMASTLINNGADAATVMAAGGWVTPQAMAGYAQLEDDIVLRGYGHAMETMHENKALGIGITTLTPAEFLKRIALETGC